MATDFSENAIVTSGGIKPGTVNTPGDLRTRIETIKDAKSIPMPFVGMIFYVIDEDKFYKVKSIKDKVMGPIVNKGALIDEYEELIPEVVIPEMPKFEFNEQGELVVTIGDVTKVFVPKSDEPEQPDTPVDPEPEEPEIPEEPEQPAEVHPEDLRILQTYGTGGKTDGILTCDFIELYNSGDFDLPLAGLTINYTAMNSRSKNQWMLIELPDMVVPAHHSFLIQGQINREAVEGSNIPVVVAEPDFVWGGEIENSGVKFVISKATEAYPAGHVDPFEIDDTIIDHIYACAEDKTHYFDGDVQPLMMDISKNKAAVQAADGVFICADYKDSMGQPKNLEMLPHNMAHGAHSPMKEVGPIPVEDYLVFYSSDLETMGDYLQIELTNSVLDYVIKEIYVDDVLTDPMFNDMEIIKYENGQMFISTAFLIDRAGFETKIELESEVHHRFKIKFYIA